MHFFPEKTLSENFVASRLKGIKKEIMWSLLSIIDIHLRMTTGKVSEIFGNYIEGRFWILQISLDSVVKVQVENVKDIYGACSVTYRNLIIIIGGQGDHQKSISTLKNCSLSKLDFNLPISMEYHAWKGLKVKILNKASIVRIYFSKVF